MSRLESLITVSQVSDRKAGPSYSVVYAEAVIVITTRETPPMIVMPDGITQANIVEEIARQVSKLSGLEVEPWRMRFVDAINENPHVIEELWEVAP